MSDCMYLISKAVVFIQSNPIDHVIFDYEEMFVQNLLPSLCNLKVSRILSSLIMCVRVVDFLVSYKDHVMYFSITALTDCNCLYMCSF